MNERTTRRQMLKLFAGASIAGAAIFAGRYVNTGLACGSPDMASPVAEPGDQVLFRIEQSGGFVPVEHLFTSLPLVSVYADGRVITTGPMIEIYPQPALPNLRQTVLTDSGLQRVLDEAHATGLFTDTAHYDGPEITDLPDTVFTLTEDGKTVEVSAYALGADETTLPERADPDARSILLELQSFMVDLANHLSTDEIAVADEPFPIARIKILAREMDPAN